MSVCVSVCAFKYESVCVRVCVEYWCATAVSITNHSCIGLNEKKKESDENKEMNMCPFIPNATEHETKRSL